MTKLNNVALLIRDGGHTGFCYYNVLKKYNLVPEKIIFHSKIKNPKKTYSIKKYIKNKIRGVFDEVGGANIVKAPKIKEIVSKIKINNVIEESGYIYTDIINVEKDVLINKKNNIEYVNIKGVNDSSFVELIKNLKQKYIIFSGGGILRGEILNLDKRFIHVHPGILPEIRGADCFIWSAIIRKKIGMSALFLNEGIDTGDVIGSKEFEVPIFKKINNVSDQTLKKILNSYVTPHYRANYLADLLLKEPNPDNWSTFKQSRSSGKQYYFMHEDIFADAKNIFFK